MAVQVTKEFIEESVARFPEYTFDYIVNISLVAAGARRACLLEEENIKSESADYIADVDNALHFVSELGLARYHQDGSNWHFIAKPDVVAEFEAEYELGLQGTRAERSAIIGRFLGFLGYDHQWYNSKIDRVVAEVTVSPAEDTPELHCHSVVFCMEREKTDLTEVSDHIAEMAQVFRRVLPDSYIVATDITYDDSIVKRLKAIVQDDHEYVFAHGYAYANDVWNYEADGKNILEALKCYILNTGASDRTLLIQTWTRYLDEIERSLADW